MGCMNSSMRDVEAQHRSRMIDIDMAANRSIDEDRVKLLLLGAGESGKSTVFKQLRLLYGEGYTDYEKTNFATYIRQNIMDTIEMLCTAVVKINPNDALIGTPAFQLIYPTTSVKEDVESIGTPAVTLKSFRKLPELTYDKAKAIELLWKTPSIQQAWRQRSGFQIVDSAERFLNKVVPIQQQGSAYMPDDDDILHTRVRTSGIREEKYIFEEKTFHFFDVGGQTNERRKWINCFQNVHAIIFLVAISEFDQTMWEDPSCNRMTDSIKLFAQIVNDPTFKDTAILLFFNKSDLLREKIKRVNVSTIKEWSDFDGTSPLDFDQVVGYFRRKFLRAVDTRVRSAQSITIYNTQATDGKTMSAVMKACTPVIIHRHLMGIGMA